MSKLYRNPISRKVLGTSWKPPQGEKMGKIIHYIFRKKCLI